MSDGILDEILGEVASISPIDDLEAQQISDCLGWIRETGDVFRREKPATPAKHLVSYFLLVDGDHVLLVDHINAGLWLPTGGHVEPGEHPRQTVRREVVEELSVAADFHQPGPVFLTATETIGKTAGHTDVSLWYVLKGDRAATYDFDRSEFRTVRWFHKDDVPYEKTDPHMGRFMKKLFG